MHRQQTDRAVERPGRCGVDIAFMQADAIGVRSGDLRGQPKHVGRWIDAGQRPSGMVVGEHLQLEAAARTEYQNIAVDRNALRKKLRRHAMQSIEPGDLPGRPFGIGFRMGRIEGWRSTLWQIVFRHADHPVVLERRFRLFESSEFGGKAVAESRSGDVSRSRCILALCSEERHRLAF